MNDLRALIDRVRNGDLPALDAAVELVERLVWEQELAAAPAGVREEVLAGLDALWKARRIQKRRSDAAIATNKARGEHNKTSIKDAVQLVGADTSERETTGVLRKYLKRNGKPLCENTVRKHVKN